MLVAGTLLPARVDLDPLQTRRAGVVGQGVDANPHLGYAVPLVVEKGGQPATVEPNSAGRGAVELVLQASAALGAVMFAAGWVFFSSLYYRLGVYPEEVGLDFSFVVVRTSLVAAVALSVLLPPYLFLRRGSEALTIPSRVFSAVVTSVACAISGTGGLLIWVSRPWDQAGWADSVLATSLAVAAVGALVVIALLASLAMTESRQGHWIAVRPGSPVLAVMALLAVLATASIAGVLTSGRVREGSAPASSLLGLVGTVSVTSDSASVSRCATVLGSSHGLTVLLDHESGDRVLRLATETIATAPVDDRCLGES